MSSLLRWTRDGVFKFQFNAFESVDQLVISPQLRARLQAITEVFLGARPEYHKMRLPWREGLMLFGASGSGKTAASRAIALALGWDHFSIPAHQILDSHLFERALSDAVSGNQRVILLEDIDQIIRTMEPSVFFTLLDHAMERADGSFWVASTRAPELMPKTQLIRPGRISQAIRLDPPSAALRKELLHNLLTPYGEDVLPEGLEASIGTLTESTAGLTYSHFEELRQVLARLQIEGRTSELWSAMQSYLQDQVIAGDRLGGVSTQAQDLEARVRQVDSRTLMAALDMTDVFRRLMEKVIADAAEEAKLQGSGGQTPP